MKGIILAGGLGTRLRPVTYVVNKNLLPIYNKPAIFYSIELLSNAGIKEIAIVAEHNYIEDFKFLLGGGADFGVNLTYFNDSPLKKGPVSALSHAENFARSSNIAVVFADNVFDITIKDQVEDFKSGAHFFFKEVKEPKRFGVAVFDKNNKLLEIEEKPENPKSKMVSMGLYLFDEKLFDYISKVKASSNGEFLMPSLAKFYIQKGDTDYTLYKGFWDDMGTFDGLYNATKYFYTKHKKIEKSRAKTLKSNIKFLDSLN